MDLFQRGALQDCDNFEIKDRISVLNNAKNNLQLSKQYGCMSAVYWLMKVLLELSMSCTAEEKQKLLDEAYNELISLAKLINDKNDIGVFLPELDPNEKINFYHLIMQQSDKMLAQYPDRKDDYLLLRDLGYQLISYNVTHSPSINTLHLKEQFLSACDQNVSVKFCRTELLFSAFLLGSQEALTKLLDMHNTKKMKKEAANLVKDVNELINYLERNGDIYGNPAISNMKNIIQMIAAIYGKSLSDADKNFYTVIAILKYKLASSLYIQPFNNRSHKNLGALKISAMILKNLLLSHHLNDAQKVNVNNFMLSVNTDVEILEQEKNVAKNRKNKKKSDSQTNTASASSVRDVKNDKSVNAEPFVNVETLPSLISDEVDSIENSDQKDIASGDAEKNEANSPNINESEEAELKSALDTPQIGKKAQKKRGKMTASRLRRARKRGETKEKSHQQSAQQTFLIEEAFTSIVDMKALKKLVDTLPLSQISLIEDSTLTAEATRSEEKEKNEDENLNSSTLSLNVLPTPKFTHYADEDASPPDVVENNHETEGEKEVVNYLEFNSITSNTLNVKDINQAGKINLSAAMSMMLTHLPNSIVVGSQVRERIRLQMLELDPDIYLKSADTDIVTSLDCPPENIQYLRIAGHEFIRNKHNNRLFSCKGLNADVYFSENLKQSLTVDAESRDFTINALYADKDGVVYDPLKRGYQDLMDGAARIIHNNISQKLLDDPILFFRLTYLRSKGYQCDYSRIILDPVIKSICDLNKINEHQIHYRLNRHFLEGTAELSLLILSRYRLYQALFNNISAQHYPWLQHEMRKIDYSYRINMQKYNHPGISRGRVYICFLIARIRSDIDKGMHPAAINEDYLEKLMLAYQYPQQLRDIILGRLSVPEQSRYIYFKKIIFEAHCYAFPDQQYCYSSNDSTFTPQMASDHSAMPVQSRAPKIYASSSYSPAHFKPAIQGVNDVRQEQKIELTDENNTNCL